MWMISFRIWMGRRLVFDSGWPDGVIARRSPLLSLGSVSICCEISSTLQVTVIQ